MGFYSCFNLDQEMMYSQVSDRHTIRLGLKQSEIDDHSTVADWCFTYENGLFTGVWLMVFHHSLNYHKRSSLVGRC